MKHGKDIGRGLTHPHFNMRLNVNIENFTKRNFRENVINC